MGAIGGVVLWIAAQIFFSSIFKVRESLRPEILAAIPFLAAAVPIATVTGVLTGALQGREKFLQTNMVSTLSTTLFQVLPLGVAYALSPNLPLVLTAAIAARGTALVALAWAAHREVASAAPPRVERAEVSALLKYGGWVSLTSLFGPMLVIVDRFAIGAVLGSAAVATYSVPFQLAQRTTVLPSALTNAMFPRMSANDAAARSALAQRAAIVLACVISPITLGAVLVMEPFLHAWVGTEIAQDASPVGRFLMIGFWANAFALVPFTRLQASGRPDLVTKLLVLQIPFYLGALYLGMTYFGLIGCAVVFAGRCVVDLLLLSVAAERRVHAWRLLLLNGALLLAAHLVSELWTWRDATWWAAATTLVAAMAAMSWLNMPADLKQQGLNRVRGILRRRMA
jgi:O-antigen/teichoic acid export membrane protein